MKQWHIYILRDPRDGVVKYVGQSTNPSYRLRLHVNVARSSKTTPSHKDNWIRQLLKEGLRPLQDILESGFGEDEWKRAEMSWIAKFRESGTPLLNRTDGGDGPGRIVSAESRAKMAAARKGRPIPQLVRDKIALAHRGVPNSPEHIAKCIAARTGKKVKADHSRYSAAIKKRIANMTPEQFAQRVKLITTAAALLKKGGKLSPERCAAMSAQFRGKPWSDRAREAHMRANKAKKQGNLTPRPQASKRC
jgi:hypothetical protein